MGSGVPCTARSVWATPVLCRCACGETLTPRRAELSLALSPTTTELAQGSADLRLSSRHLQLCVPPRQTPGVGGEVVTRQVMFPSEWG